jgi:hypothetical protein
VVWGHWQPRQVLADGLRTTQQAMEDGVHRVRSVATHRRFLRCRCITAGPRHFVDDSISSHSKPGGYARAQLMNSSARFKVSTSHYPPVRLSSVEEDRTRVGGSNERVGHLCWT